MATQGLSTMTIARTERRGSIALVLLVAVLLVASAAGLMMVGRHAAGPYVTIFLAVLAVIGVFAVFALAAGVLRVSVRDAGGPMLKKIVDQAHDGIIVTDSAGPGAVRQRRLPGVRRRGRSRRGASGGARFRR